MFRISTSAIPFVIFIAVVFSGCAITGTIIDTPPAPSSTLSGVVVNLDGEPVTGATVFLDRTTYSMETSQDGGFSFSRVPQAHFRLVVHADDGSIVERRILTGDDRLSPLEIVLDGTRTLVRAGSNGVGSAISQEVLSLLSGEADGCQIMNPEVLSVDEGRRSGVTHRTIRASAPVHVENALTGYRTTIYIDNISIYTQGNESSYRADAYYRFDAIEADSVVQEEQWDAMRRRVYLGSMQHFLRSLAAGHLREDGFAVSRQFQSTHSAPGITGLQETVATWTAVREDQLVSGRRGAYIHHLRVPTTIRVAHRGQSVTPDAARYLGGLEVDGRPTSRLSTSEAMVAFTRDGLPADGSAYLADGFWGAPRFCYRLPLDLFVDVD
jgi:hypothetical protein